MLSLNVLVITAYLGDTYVMLNGIVQMALMSNMSCVKRREIVQICLSVKVHRFACIFMTSVILLMIAHIKMMK